MKCRFGAFELNEELWELRRHRQRVPIQRKALETVLFLIRHRERVVSRQELRAGVWPGTTVSDAAITHAIVQARRALDDEQGAWIRTVRGKGMRFVGAVDEENEEQAALSPATARAWQAGGCREMEAFERRFLRCVDGLLGVVLEITRPVTTGPSMPDLSERGGAIDGVLWDLAQRFRLARNAAGARHTLEYLIERSPESRWASRARILLADELMLLVDEAAERGDEKRRP